MNTITIPEKAINYVKEKYNFDLLGFKDSSGDMRINHVLAFFIFEECCGGVIDVVDEILERAKESEESFVYKLSRINSVNKKIADNRLTSNARTIVLQSVEKTVIYLDDFLEILPDHFEYVRDRAYQFAYVRVEVTDDDWEPNVDSYGIEDDKDSEDELENTLEQTAKPQEAVSLVFLSWD